MEQHDKTWADVFGRDVSATQMLAMYWADRGDIPLRLADWLTLQCLELYGSEGCDGINWDAMALGLEQDAQRDVAWHVAHDPEPEEAEPDPAPAFFVPETLTLTTAHAASSYNRPVLLIDGQAFGPADLTPAGAMAADLVTEWAERFCSYARFKRRRPADDPGREALQVLRDLLQLYDSKSLTPPYHSPSTTWDRARAVLARAEEA